MRALVLPAMALLIFALSFSQAHAQESIELKNSDHTYVDSVGMTNIVGIVNNKGDVPLQITMGLNITNVGGKTATLQEQPYTNVIFPGKGAPFKFKLAEGQAAAGKPYILKAEKVDQSFFNTLVFNYTNMAVGKEKALVGTVKNAGPFEYRNLTVFASVHDKDMVDLDSVRSNVISVLRPGEVATFEARPDPAVKADVYYYSCAGFDPNEPVSTIPVGGGKFMAYSFESVAKVSSLRYDNSTDSMDFGITHYNPKGGPASLTFPQLSQNQTITVFMDGAPNNASIKMDGKTVYVNIFVPPGDHEVQVQGVRTVPEFPFALLGLAAVTAVAIAASKFKAAFKIS